MKKLNTYILACILVVTSLLAPFAFALDLQTAKKQGLVGEMTNGYLGSPSKKADSSVQALIKDINAKRKAKYKKIANKVGKPLSVVENLAGEKAQSKTKAGHYVQGSDGKWRKR